MNTDGATLNPYRAGAIYALNWHCALAYAAHLQTLARQREAFSFRLRWAVDTRMAELKSIEAKAKNRPRFSATEE